MIVLDALKRAHIATLKSNDHNIQPSTNGCVYIFSYKYIISCLSLTFGLQELMCKTHYCKLAVLKVTGDTAVIYALATCLFTMLFWPVFHKMLS